jgi:hypothetical protein
MERHSGDSDDDEEDFHGFSDIEVQELDSDSVSESEISNDSFDGIFEWKDNLSSVSVEDFTADFGPQHGLGLDASPKDFFDLFFGDAFFDLIVHVQFRTPIQNATIQILQPTATKCLHFLA